MSLFVSIIATYGIMLLADALWLGLIAKTFYRTRLGWLLAESPNWFAAGAFYAVYGVGILLFVVQPALRGGMPLGRVALYGAVFGIVAYATYDLTNQATVRNWPALVTVVDLAWGAGLTMVVSIGAVMLARYVA